jgi:hypothetical protein
MSRTGSGTGGYSKVPDCRSSRLPEGEVITKAPKERMRALLQWTDSVVAETRRAAPYDDIPMNHGNSCRFIRTLYSSEQEGGREP